MHYTERIISKFNTQTLHKLQNKLSKIIKANIKWRILKKIVEVTILSRCNCKYLSGKI